MTNPSWWRSRAGLRCATLLFPPAALVLNWRSDQPLKSKWIGTAGVLLFSVLYAALIIFLLIEFTGLQLEWRGGYIPALTYHKTVPNYAALERDRAAHSAPALPSNSDTQAPYWTAFRGPDGAGNYNEMAVLTNWPKGGPKLLWRQPCGGGYSSFALAHGRAFTLEQRREHETLVAYGLNTGRELWTNGWRALFSESMGGDGPRSTPAYDDGRLYALGAEGELRCVNAATGQSIWTHNIIAENGGSVPTYGVAASPLLIGDKLIVLSGAGAGHSVLCYNKQDGKLIWAALNDVTGYATPVRCAFGGIPQIIVCCEKRTLGLKLADGELLWECSWHVLNDQLPISQPLLLGTNRFLLSASYFTGSGLFALTNNGSRLETHQVWKNRNLKAKFSSPVVWDGYVYGLDEDMLVCIDPENGDRKWKEGRYGYGQLLLARGWLIILTGDGDLALVRANPQKYQEVARVPGIKGKTWNYPAIAEGKLLIRNAVEMACYDISQ